MKEKKLYKIAFMGDKDHGCDIISTLESWGGSNCYLRTGSDPEYAYFINDLGAIDFIHNSALLSEEMKNFYFLFWYDYNIECHLKVGESFNYGGQDYDVDSIFFDANNRCIVYKLKSFGIGVEYITNNELTPTEKYQTEEENNMKTKLAIKGHATRGKEVIELLEMMGGKNIAYHGTDINVVYTIDNKEIIRSLFFNDSILMKMEYNIFTIEEFLKKYPFKVGDKVFDIADGDTGVITIMKWDEDVSDMKYHIAFDNGDMGWFTIDTFGFLKKDKNLEKEKNMNKKLAIKGHPTRSNEVIKLLVILGGHNGSNLLGNKSDYVYFITDSGDIGCIDTNHILTDYFTLEKFLEEYPFKVGDKVFLYDNITEGCVTGMEWDEDKGTVKYCVYTSSECWCDVKELLKWNNIDLDERHYRDNIEEKDKDKAKAPDMKGEDYSGKRFGYKIPDGYEFDVVVDGKIFLKPIKPKYPTTYEDCCKVLGISYRAQLSYTYPDVERGNIYLTKEKHLLDAFMKLRICRNAYWKIAGDEMRLGKSWQPSWSDINEDVYGIQLVTDDTNMIYHESASFTFPTEEILNEFCKNFKDLIEQCKELL